MRGAIHAIEMDTGYDSKHLIDLALQFPEGSKYDPDHKLALVRELRRRLADRRGVAAITSAQPPDDNFYRTAAVALNGEKSSAQNLQSILHYSYVQANYFQTLGIPLFLGHDFQPQAGPNEHSIILSESAAKQLWPDENPIGRTLPLGPTDEECTIRPSFLRTGRPTRSSESLAIHEALNSTAATPGASTCLYPMTGFRPTPYSSVPNPTRGPVIRMIDSVLSSTDPDLVATASTLDERLRQTASFITSCLAASIASTAAYSGCCSPCWEYTERSAISSSSAPAKSASASRSAHKSATSFRSSCAKVHGLCSLDCFSECFSRLQSLTCCVAFSMDSTPSIASRSAVCLCCFC